MALEIHSTVFAPGQPIPEKYSQDGENISPPLQWSGIPSATRELVLLVVDPDAPKPNPFIHWVLYKIPPSVMALPEAVPTENILKVPAGAMQGQNSAGKIGYVGPAPPLGHGTHHYHFKLLALDTTLSVVPALDKGALHALLVGHILEQAELVGTYERGAVINRIKTAVMGE
jgi:hypothetical protein